MDLAAPQYCQVCLFPKINEQMAQNPETGRKGKWCMFLLPFMCIFGCGAYTVYAMHVVYVHTCVLVTTDSSKYILHFVLG